MENLPESDFEKQLWEVKLASRSELKTHEEWSALNFQSKFDLSLDSVKDNVERIDASYVTREEFIRRFEKPYKPVVIRNAQKEWNAVQSWTPEELGRRCGEKKFKIGEDDDGYSVRLRMDHYLRYMKETRDDSPMYIFDSSFVERSCDKELERGYCVPEYFEDDLFRYAEMKRRPPYRWFVMGPARSGTGIHIDPLGTSAWNGLIHGYKRWCLLPTCVPKDLLKVSKVLAPKQTNEAVSWFRFAYPRTQTSEWPQQYGPLEILQGPGETVFVPGGWWHVVVNLTDTVAVTQNFASVTNFPVVWHKTVRGRPKLARQWYSVLRSVRPEVADMADAVDIKAKTDIQSDDSSSCSSSSDSSSDSDNETDPARTMEARKRRPSPDSGRGSSDSAAGQSQTKRAKDEFFV